MRSILAASLLLSPMLYAASAVASQPKTDTSAPQERRVSTGITAPVILDSTNLHIPASALDRTIPSESTLVLALNVDEKGNPQNVHVVHSGSPDLDARVVAAVRQSHFRPARLDNQAVATDVNLVVTVQR